MDLTGIERYIERALELEQMFYFGVFIGLISAGVIAFLAVVLVRLTLNKVSPK